MSKRNISLGKKGRRLGCTITNNPKDSSIKRNYPPGQHGVKGRSKPTDYGLQLSEKQKLKFFYGNITEKKFRTIFKKAKYGRSSTGDQFISLLERRLDSFVRRAGWAVSAGDARQKVTHGFFLVNGKKVNIPSYELKAEDVVSVIADKKDHPSIKLSLEKSGTLHADYLEMSSDKSSATLVKFPMVDEVTYPFQLDKNKIIELYSRSV
jgi:small subunit ribosomal protein S4